MLLNKGVSVSYFVSTIKYDLIAIVLYAVTVGTLDNYSVFKSINVPLAITAIIGTAVSLLLAFRTSQSYERWWEARIIWGAIVNDSRTLIRQLGTFYVGQNKQSFIREFAFRQAHWCRILTNSLRRLPLDAESKKYVESKNMDSRNLPNAVLSLHSEDIRIALEQNSINQFQQVQLDSTIVNLCNSMGRCERIKNTVFPRSYSILIHFLIYVFLTLLPFGLSDDNVLLEVFLGVMIPSIFIAIEKTSILMQDPFENLPLDTPMTAISTTIETNLREMIGEPLSPIKESEHKYFVL